MSSAAPEPATRSHFPELLVEQMRATAEARREAVIWREMLQQALAIANGQHSELTRLREQHVRDCDELRRLRADLMQRDTRREPRTRTPHSAVSTAHEATVQ